ncbi:four-carbon acid sugar kinase family protein [Pontibacter qinzhouensis]|uniref:Four-carbon acid sugar kinase family protein n=1 Tax=Pontibacter qinzhouensis TaxID=2603253 RepID=A0A5C8K807_9BACT|nr:four-carbon acid sugar kinase family protein [Pontibacter qinzhouensis]TXK46082.1 four-carbon acid sugar kinase family protein [Pontibacter qinzhouensis]
MAKPAKLLLAYYGDDFTGSTDALEFLSRAGVKTALFIQPPTPEQLARYEGLQAIGVAGMTRAMAPAEMEQELKPAFAALRTLGAAHVHYKVCSTFDSSPAIGSIGKAIEVATEIFQARFVPLLVAAPALGRYCAFGNLFARMGIGSKGTIHRLDRHPSMSKHPTTPADESDLRLHLSRQTSKKIGLLDILQVVLPEAEARKALENTLAEGAEVVLFDAIYENQMAGIGKLIDAFATPEKPLFSVGSSGIEMALGNYWQEAGRLQAPQYWPDLGVAEPLLVVSGSCSPVTSGQIEWAVSEGGFTQIALDTAAIARQTEAAHVIAACAAEAIATINKGRSVIVHTNCGGNDTRLKETKQILAKTGDKSQTAQLYGTALGQIAREVAAHTVVRRVVIAGGDTSSFAARAMGIESVEMVAPLSPGAPICKAFAPGSPIDGLEVNFKGGQVGSPDYFGLASQGKALRTNQQLTNY